MADLAFLRDFRTDDFFGVAVFALAFFFVTAGVASVGWIRSGGTAALDAGGDWFLSIGVVERTWSCRKNLDWRRRLDWDSRCCLGQHVQVVEERRPRHAWPKVKVEARPVLERGAAEGAEMPPVRIVHMEMIAVGRHRKEEVLGEKQLWKTDKKYGDGEGLQLPVPAL